MLCCAQQSFFEDESAVYMVMELCEGGDLYKYMKSKGRLPEDEAVSFFEQAR